MSVSKINGKWECRYYVRSSDGSLKSTRKRGFTTKQAAQAWELNHRHDSEPSEEVTAAARQHCLKLRGKCRMAII